MADTPKPKRPVPEALRKNQQPGMVSSRKGIPNKLSGLAKDNIAAVFERIGGVDAMVEWAMANRDEFYKSVYPKLLPLQVTGSNDGPVVVQIVRYCADSTDS